MRWVWLHTYVVLVKDVHMVLFMFIICYDPTFVSFFNKHITFCVLPAFHAAASGGRGAGNELSINQPQFNKMNIQDVRSVCCYLDPSYPLTAPEGHLLGSSPVSWLFLALRSLILAD